LHRLNCIGIQLVNYGASCKSLMRSDRIGKTLVPKAFGSGVRVAPVAIPLPYISIVVRFLFNILNTIIITKLSYTFKPTIVPKKNGQRDTVFSFIRGSCIIYRIITNYPFCMVNISINSIIK
jgi:hypothetical protein